MVPSGKPADGVDQTAETADVLIWPGPGAPEVQPGLVAALCECGIRTRVRPEGGPPDELETGTRAGPTAGTILRWSKEATPAELAFCREILSEGRAGVVMLVASGAARDAEPGRLPVRERTGGATDLPPKDTGADGHLLCADPAWGAGALVSLAEAAVSLARERASRERAAAHIDDLAEAERNFVAIASHDLRTPVSTLRLVHDLLRTGLAASSGTSAGRQARGKIDVEELIDIMARNLDRMDAFVNDILDAWRLYRGGYEIEPEPVSLNAIVEDVVASLFPVAIRKDIALDLVTEPAVGLILAGEKRVGQVVANLVGNALKYTPPGGTVAVCTRRDEGGALMEVADTGPGIGPEDAARLFQRFARGNARATAGEPSTGLGLYICREIVESLGGRIWVESTPPDGSRFFVHWPAAAAR